MYPYMVEYLGTLLLIGTVAFTGNPVFIVAARALALGMGRAQQGGMLGIVCLHTSALRVEPSHLAVELLDGVGERGDHLRFESVHRRRHREPSRSVRRVVVEQRRQQRKLGQRKELELDEVVRRREHEPKLPSVRIDRLLLDRTGGSERRAVTQYRPKSQRVLHVIKEPNLQAQEASESAGVSSMSNSSEPRHARHQGHQAQVYRGMRVHTLHDRPL